MSRKVKLTSSKIFVLQRQIRITIVAIFNIVEGFFSYGRVCHMGGLVFFPFSVFVDVSNVVHTVHATTKTSSMLFLSLLPFSFSAPRLLRHLSDIGGGERPSPKEKARLLWLDIVKRSRRNMGNGRPQARNDEKWGKRKDRVESNQILFFGGGETYSKAGSSVKAVEKCFRF